MFNFFHSEIDKKKAECLIEAAKERRTKLEDEQRKKKLMASKVRTDSRKIKAEEEEKKNLCLLRP